MHTNRRGAFNCDVPGPSAAGIRWQRPLPAAVGELFRYGGSERYG